MDKQEEAPHPANRMREIREAKNLTLQQVATIAGTTPKQIARLETGERRLSHGWMQRVAPALGVQPRDLVSELVTVPVVGYVGAGEIVENFEDPGGGLRQVEPPDGAEESQAVEVRGESMWPRYQPGDLLFFFSADGVTDDCFNKDCVVQVVNGPTYVKRLKRGNAPGRFTLTSYRSPDIEDVEVQWAARIRWIEPR